jgi:hypothetical protein
VCVVPLPVPVIVIEYVPGVVFDATARVAVDVPDPGAAIDDGLKLTVTPVGAPLADSATAESNPPLTVVVMVEVPLLPCATETVVGLAATVNAGTGAGDIVRVIAVVSVSPPPLPVTVIVYVPAAANEVALNVAVEFPAPGAAIDDGLKLTVTPDGIPLAVNATAELNPPLTAVVIVVVPVTVVAAPLLLFVS